ncbi:MAG: hypothetical protein U0V02_06030 [Anaerolineales bacterium]
MPTVAAAATNTAAPAAAAVQSSDLTPVYVDNVLGKGVFKDITFSSDKITLNCYPREFDITMTALHPDVTRAEMYYRVLEAPSFFRYSDWYLVGKRTQTVKVVSTRTFKAERHYTHQIGARLGSGCHRIPICWSKQGRQYGGSYPEKDRKTGLLYLKSARKLK